MSSGKGELVVLHDRRDRLEANRLVRKLEAAGYRVARQDNPAAPRRISYETPTVLLWSRNAPERSFKTALNSDSAVIAKLDDRVAPAGAQVTDLRGWLGQDRHLGWQTLLEAVTPAASAKAQPSTQAAATPMAAPYEPAPKASVPASPRIEPSKPKKLSAVGLVIGVAIILAAIAGAAAFIL